MTSKLIRFLLVCLLLSGQGFAGTDSRSEDFYLNGKASDGQLLVLPLKRVFPFPLSGLGLEKSPVCITPTRFNQYPLEYRLISEKLNQPVANVAQPVEHRYLISLAGQHFAQDDEEEDHWITLI